MARKKFITKEIRNSIAKLHYNHPSYPAAKIRGIVIKDRLKQDKKADKNWPSLSTVHKIIQSLREDSFLDREWTVQSLAMSEIPAEALPIVLDAYGWTVAWGLEKRLTVREAKWVARLYRVLRDVEDLTIAARECAIYEIENEVIDNKGLSLVDADFLSRAIYRKPGVTYKYINGDFQLDLHDRPIAYELDFKPLTEDNTVE